MDGKRIKEWLDHRTGLDVLREMGEHKRVPVHRHSIWYYFGGMALFLFMVQVATGIMLMLYYRPSADEAYESVQFLITQVPFGWLIRSVHSWSANLLIGVLFVHLFSVFFLKSYRAPREMTWISGMILFGLAMGFGFSGYLLPWNTLAYFATRVGTGIAGSLPVVGDFMVRFLRGGDYITGGTLSRFYGWHVAILPALTTALLGVHLYLVQRHGMSSPVSEEKKSGPKREMRFLPDFLLRDLFGWTVAVGVLAALAALFPWELGAKADPFAPAPAHIRPEWYFMFMFQTLKFIPGGEFLRIGNEAWVNMAFGFIGLLALLTPFLDRGIEKRGRSPIFTTIGVVAVVFVAVMTAIGYHAWWPIGVTIVLWLGPLAVGRAMVRGQEERR